MGKVNIKDIVPGMFLGSDARDKAGKLLLPKGTELTTKNIQIFKMWGVIEADIVGQNREMAAKEQTHDLTDAEVAAIKAELEYIFKFNDTGIPAIKEMMRVSLARKIKAATSEAQHAD